MYISQDAGLKKLIQFSQYTPALGSNVDGWTMIVMLQIREIPTRNQRLHDNMDCAVDQAEVLSLL